MRSHKDDLLHPAQPAGGHDAAGSHLGDVAQLMRSPNFMRSPKVLLNERPVLQGLCDEIIIRGSLGHFALWYNFISVKGARV